MRQKQFLKRCPKAKLIMILLLMVVATQTFAQITVNIQNKPLREALKEIERVSQLQVLLQRITPRIRKEQYATANKRHD